jgi:hypothetical protein
MVFNVVDLALGVNPFESMRRISIHKPIPVWSSSVGEKNSDLMQGLWGVLPEIKDHIWIGQVGSWVPLLGVDEIWELNGIIDEEDWSVISYHVVVAFLGVELDGESSWVPHSIRSASLTSDSGEPKEQWSLLSNLVQKCGPREWRDVVGNL